MMKLSELPLVTVPTTYIAQIFPPSRGPILKMAWKRSDQKLKQPL